MYSDRREYFDYERTYCGPYSPSERNSRRPIEKCRVGRENKRSIYTTSAKDDLSYHVYGNFHASYDDTNVSTMCKNVPTRHENINECSNFWYDVTDNDNYGFQLNSGLKKPSQHLNHHNSSSYSDGGNNLHNLSNRSYYSSCDVTNHAQPHCVTHYASQHNELHTKTPNRLNYAFKKQDFPAFDRNNINKSIKLFELRLQFLEIVDSKQKFAAAWEVFDEDIINTFLESANEKQRFQYDALREYVQSFAFPNYACHKNLDIDYKTDNFAELIIAADQALACPFEEQKKAWMIIKADEKLSVQMQKYISLPLKEFKHQTDRLIRDRDHHLTDNNYPESSYNMCTTSPKQEAYDLACNEREEHYNYNETNFYNNDETDEVAANGNLTTRALDNWRVNKQTTIEIRNGSSNCNVSRPLYPLAIP